MSARLASPIPAYRRELTLRGRRALLESIDLLTGDALEELPEMENNGLPFANSTLGVFFPHPELPRYSPSVVRRLVVCLLTAGFQLAQTTRYELACVGEELAMNALVSTAEGIAEDRVTHAVGCFQGRDPPDLRENRIGTVRAKIDLEQRHFDVAALIGSEKGNLHSVRL